MVKAKLIAFLVGVLVLSAVACGGQTRAAATTVPARATPAATATPTPSPDIEATVAAAVAATVDALPTLPPTPLPAALTSYASTDGRPGPHGDPRTHS